MSSTTKDSECGDSSTSDPFLSFALDGPNSESQEPEEEDHYRKGGYHPIAMFDVLIGRYTVIVKLGTGHFSTVWLCWDIQEKQFVSIKVSKSAVQYKEASEDEIEILSAVRDCPSDEYKFRSRIMRLHHNFNLNGINGTHVCLVTEVLGCNLLKLILRSDYNGIPLENVRTIIKQVLMGVAYLHGKCNIIHTDIKPENILIQMTDDYRKLAFKALYLMHRKVELPVQFKANAPPEQMKAQQNLYRKKQKKKEKKKQTKNRQANVFREEPSGSAAPTELNSGTLTTSNKIFENVEYPDYIADILNAGECLINSGLNEPDPAFDVCPNLKVKIIDLGNACWINKHFTEDVQTRQYRCPEVIVGASYGPESDVWSIGCLAYELATGDFLFNPREYGSNRDIEHLNLIYKYLGPLPSNIVNKGTFSKEYYRDGKLRRFDVGQRSTIYEQLINEKGWDPPIARLFSDFLEKLLNVDPMKRIGAFASLSHPFLKKEHDFSALHHLYRRRKDESTDDETSWENSNTSKSPKS